MLGSIDVIGRGPGWRRLPWRSGEPDWAIGAMVIDEPFAALWRRAARCLLGAGALTSTSDGSFFIRLGRRRRRGRALPIHARAASINR